MYTVIDHIIIRFVPAPVNMNEFPNTILVRYSLGALTDAWLAVSSTRWNVTPGYTRICSQTAIRGRAGIKRSFANLSTMFIRIAEDLSMHCEMNETRM